MSSNITSFNKALKCLHKGEIKLDDSDVEGSRMKHGSMVEFFGSLNMEEFTEGGLRFKKNLF